MGSMMSKNKGSVNAPPRGVPGAPGMPGMPYMQPQPPVGPSPPFIQSNMLNPLGGPPPSMYSPQQPQPFQPPMQSHPGPPSFSSPMNQNGLANYENDLLLANLTGWTVDDIGRLRHEFASYANSYGVIDREGFLKLYVASLLNMTWDTLERDAEVAFRNFDLNRTGGLDFNEYITACSRMSRGLYPSSSSQPNLPY